MLAQSVLFAASFGSRQRTELLSHDSLTPRGTKKISDGCTDHSGASAHVPTPRAPLSLGIHVSEHFSSEPDPDENRLCHVAVSSVGIYFNPSSKIMFDKV
jgi:hypothetical protein